MRTVYFVCVLCVAVAVAAAKKSHKENAGEAEHLSHGAKKYAKEHQNPHHFEHNKEVPEENVNEAEPRAKQAPLEVAEQEVELQGHLERSHSKDVLAEEADKDLHLQDLAYEEKLQHKEKRHRKPEATDKKKGGGSKAEKKLFADQEADRHSVDEKVIEDSFEPLEQEPADTKPKKSSKDKKQKHKEEKRQHKDEKKQHKDKTKSKKAHEKKQKDGKKNKKNKKEKKY